MNMVPVSGAWVITHYTDMIIRRTFPSVAPSQKSGSNLFFQDVVVFGNWQDSDQETEVLISALGATKQSLPQLVAERARTQKVSVAHFFVLRLSTPLLTLSSPLPYRHCTFLLRP